MGPAAAISDEVLARARVKKALEGDLNIDFHAARIANICTGNHLLQSKEYSRYLPQLN